MYHICRFVWASRCQRGLEAASQQTTNLLVEAHTLGPVSNSSRTPTSSIIDCPGKQHQPLMDLPQLQSAALAEIQLQQHFTVCTPQQHSDAPGLKAKPTCCQADCRALKNGKHGTRSYTCSVSWTGCSSSFLLRALLLLFSRWQQNMWLTNSWSLSLELSKLQDSGMSRMSACQHYQYTCHGASELEHHFTAQFQALVFTSWVCTHQCFSCHRARI